ncbi:caspase family protein [Actinomadura sp. 7K534]|uniref:caspase, EACC1-associated type n=1 Tax=Actinomadura sp. 7K534 TaxID=2530366 RepID=UPI001404C0A2|nr:caspase family protein [Actinomadura sp. 7K534]
MAADRYESADLGSLYAPAHDVDALASALAEPHIGGFEVQRVFNRPVHEVNLAIEDFFCDKGPDDVLLLYVSCHGVKDDAGHLYFATTNTRVTRLGATGIASTFVRDRMSQSRSRNIILLLDCCYSGAFVEGMVRRGDGGVGINERLSGSGRAILSSSSALEYAFELDERHMTKEISLAGTGQRREGRPSIFTEALVNGLTTGEADQNQDGRISVDELYDYAYSKVTEANPNQTPTKFSDVSGELIVAWSPATAKPPSLPDEVVAATKNPLGRVRAVAVDALKELALAGDAVGRLAYEQLKELLDDDSRTVIAKARQAIAEIDRAEPGAHASVPVWPTPAQRVAVPPPRPSLGSAPLPPGDPAPVPPPLNPLSAMPWPSAPASPERPFSEGPVPPPWHPAAGAPRGPQDEPLRGGSVLAYFLPFFTSLLLLFSRSRNVKYHAIHSALTDALTTGYIIAASIPLLVYSGIRYGSEEIPQGDVPFNAYMVGWFVVPLALRAYCLYQITRRGTARLKLIGTLAQRLAYGGPVHTSRRS